MADCIFCGIAAGEIPSAKVYEDESVLAFRDLEPQAPTHVLIIPKKHIGSLAEAQEEDLKLLGHIQLCAGKIAEKEGLKNGFRLVSNCGEEAGQSVKHLHYHLLGGRGFSWPPG